MEVQRVSLLLNIHLHLAQRLRLCRVMPPLSNAERAESSVDCISMSSALRQAVWRQKKYSLCKWNWYPIHACLSRGIGRTQQTVLLSTSGGNSRRSWPVRVPAEVTRTGSTTCPVLAPTSWCPPQEFRQCSGYKVRDTHVTLQPVYQHTQSPT